MHLSIVRDEASIVIEPDDKTWRREGVRCSVLEPTSADEMVLWPQGVGRLRGKTTGEMRMLRNRFQLQPVGRQCRRRHRGDVTSATSTS